MKNSTFLILAAAASAALLASTVQADSFTLLIYESKSDLAARKDPAKSTAYWAAYGDYARKMTEAGILRGGSALSGNAGTHTVSLVGGKPQTTERPLAKASLELGGYFIIEVANREAALEWARKAPCLATGAVEVKPHSPNPTMPAKPSL